MFLISACGGEGDVKTKPGARGQQGPAGEDGQDGEDGQSQIDIFVSRAYCGAGGNDAAESDGYAFGFNAFCVLQEGVNAAASNYGSTVHVAASSAADSYAPVYIPGNAANLTVVGDPGDTATAGAGPDAAVIDGAGLNASAFIIAAGASKVAIKGFKLQNFAYDGASSSTGNAVYTEGAPENVAVQHNTLSGVRRGIFAGALDVVAADWLVEYNLIEDFTDAGIMLTNLGASVTDNVLQNATGIDGIRVRAAGQSAPVTLDTLSITGNDVHAMLTGAAIAVRAEDLADSVAVVLRNAAISDNAVLNAATGVLFSSAGANALIDSLSASANTATANSDGIAFAGDGVFAAVTVNQNTVENNTANGVHVLAGVDVTGISLEENAISGNAYGIRNENTTGSDPFLAATPNWFGDASGPGGAGPGTGDPVSAKVTYSPWCADAACTTLSP